MLSELVYRKLTHLNFRRREECVTLIDWLAPAPGERILDIGCGDGWWDHRIQATGAHVVGVDVNEQRLEIARTRNQTDRVEYHFMNAENLEFQDQSFTKAISMCVIEHFIDEDAVLAEVARVLVSGAPFILSADSLSNSELTEDERDVHRERYAVNTFYTIESLRNKLDQHGFELEDAKYILTNRVTLGLVRFSWKMEDWAESGRPGINQIGAVGTGFVSTIGRLIAGITEAVAPRKDAGLTILARARKR
jgi:ubiquinone/menaquinone biosynthesis C-methylase UbiE